MLAGPRIALLSTPRTYTDKVLATQRANLIAYWRLNESSGTITQNAQGVLARDGTYSGVTLGQPGIGDGSSAPSFDGVNDYADIYSASLSTAFNGSEGTVVLWFKTANIGVWTDGAVRHLVDFIAGDGTGNYRVQVFKPAAGATIDWYYRSNAVSKALAVATDSAIGWLHTAMTWSAAADQVKFYLNGVQQGATLTALGVWNQTTLLAGSTTIGSANTTPTTVWHGALAHVAVWTTPLTAAQIAALAVR